MIAFGRTRYCFATAKKFMDLEKKYGCNNYKPLPIVIAQGQGIYVWDVSGTKYLDFLAGYSAVNQGHCHPRILKTFTSQAEKLTLTSRAFYNNQLGECQEFLSKTFGFDKVLMMNTGCEAGESAIKFARRWAYTVKGVPENEAICLFALGNFWGRSIAACGSSEDPDRFHQFGPYGLKFDLIEYNNLKSLEDKLIKDGPKIASLMIEPIQGEMGVVIPDQGYLKNVQQLCKKHNVLLIFDEVQTGLGRTGQMLCSDWDDVKPDMVCLGKALSGGFMPVSALLGSDQIFDQIKPGHHGSTYGGNPLACAIAKTSVKVLMEENMIENSRVRGLELLETLKQIARSADYIIDVRGKGLFIALQFDPKKGYKAWDFCLMLRDYGILAKPTHSDTVRLSPPLIITAEELAGATLIFEKCVKNFPNYRPVV